MSRVKAFLSEYEDMGNIFDYKDYGSIPTFIQEIVEEELTVDSYKKATLTDINFVLNDLMEELNGSNEIINIGVYDE